MALKVYLGRKALNPCRCAIFRMLILGILNSWSWPIAWCWVQRWFFPDLARKSQSNVLIHCQAGVSRSATIVVAYLMQHCNLSMNEAYSLVKNKRSVISPNFNFMGQLMEYENTLKTLKGGSGSNVVLPSPSGSQAKQPRILSIETSL